MSINTTSPQPDAQTVAAAIDWLVQLRCERTPALCAACSHWRAQHPDHELAWQRICALDQTLCQQYRHLHARAAARALNAALCGARHRPRTSHREPNPFSCVFQDSPAPSPATPPTHPSENQHATTIPSRTPSP